MLEEHVVGGNSFPPVEIIFAKIFFLGKYAFILEKTVRLFYHDYFSSLTKLEKDFYDIFNMEIWYDS